MILLLPFFLKMIYFDLPVIGILRRQLRAAEEHIRNRSRAAEGRWSCDKWQQSTAGRTTSKVCINTAS
jgi:Eukaryotic Mediator 12 subunit domain.